MSFALILLKLTGATLLLLFSVQLVRQGVENAYGALLKRRLGATSRGRIGPAMSGFSLAILLQSSTAVAILTAGLGASGMLGLGTGLSVLLGADLGSAVVVRILSFDPGWLMPLLLAAGGFLHLKTSASRLKETGRILLGIAFVLLSLRLIGEATAPLKQSDLLPAIVGYLASDHITAMVVAALFTWAIHSSVAAMVLILSLCHNGLLPVDAGYPLVLGANLGSGFIAFWLSRSLTPEARRIPAGNLLFRTAGSLAFLLGGDVVLPLLPSAEKAEAAQLANLHLLFNGVLLLASMPIVEMMARLLERFIPSLPADPTAEDPYASRISALDPALHDRPGQALAAATREVLFMGEILRHMFGSIMDVLETPTVAAIDKIRQLEGHMNRSQRAIKLYIAAINRRSLTEAESQRGVELIDAAINLEHAGDIVSKALLELAEDRLNGEPGCSPEGWSELREIHGIVRQNMAYAFNLLVYADPELARSLVRGKEKVRGLVRRSHESHLERLKANRRESIESSNTHVETSRALKEINALLATLAYPLLTQRGDLSESRLSGANTNIDKIVKSI